MPERKVVVIGDLHFGISQTERVANELDIFLKYISENKVDLLVFNGDYFDHRMNLNDPSALIGMNFFNAVLTIAKEKNIIVRMIEGTMSHDRLQPEIFNNFVIDDSGKKIIDFKFYPTIATENILGMNCLFVPEEYPVNIDEYYDPYKAGKYKLMFVHGTWNFVNFGNAIDNNRNDMNTCPVFKVEEWKPALEKGLAICGHIHGRHIFKDKDGVKVIYPGSFSAWSFDQISKRGFICITVNTDNNDISYEFIDNDKAPTYANLSVSDLGLDLEKATAEEIRNAIEEQKKKVDFLKVNLDDLSGDKKEILKNLYSGNKNIIPVTDSEKAEMFGNESISEAYKKYDYLLKDNLPIEQAISKFIKEELGKDISAESIGEIIKEETK